jgi:hypothetical protein
LSIEPTLPWISKGGYRVSVTITVFCGNTEVSRITETEEAVRPQGTPKYEFPQGTAPSGPIIVWAPNLVRETTTPV